MSDVKLDDVAITSFLNDGRIGFTVRCEDRIWDAVCPLLEVSISQGHVEEVIPRGRYQSGQRMLWTATYQVIDAFAWFVLGDLLSKLMLKVAEQVGMFGVKS